MEELIAYRKDLLSALVGVADQLSIMVAAMPSGSWQIQFGMESHSPHFLLAHLRELEAQVFSVQLMRFLDEDIPLLRLFDEETWMADRYKPDEPARKILAEFSSLRMYEVAWLRDLPQAGWSRAARHPWWGLRTLQWWAELQLEESHQHLGKLAS